MTRNVGKQNLLEKYTFSPVYHTDNDPAFIYNSLRKNRLTDECIIHFNYTWIAIVEDRYVSINCKQSTFTNDRI